MTKALYHSFLAFCCLMAACHLLKAQTVVCNDQINVTVNHQCAIDISVDAFLEGDSGLNDDVLNGLYTYEIYNHTGIIVEGGINGPTSGGHDLAAWVNSLLFFKVYYDDNDIPECWGTVLLEDKNPPTINCEYCPPVGGDEPADYDPDCVRNCFEADILLEKYDFRLRDKIIQEDYEDFLRDHVVDNCSNWEEELTSYHDQWTNLGPCIGSRLKRTWTVGYYNYDNSVSAVTCSREYFFKPIDLDEVKEYKTDPVTNRQIVEPIRNCLILPVNVVEIPCSENISPAGIAAYFDNKDTKDLDTDDDNKDPYELDVDLVVENNEGIPYAYPHFYQDGKSGIAPHPQAVNNEMCNLISHYTDTDLEVCKPGCQGNKKILREWTILDWCTSEFIHYNQVIKSVDKNGPHIDVPEHTVSVDPWNCTATVHLPVPEHIFDNCDNFYSYTIGQTGGYAVTGDDINGFKLHDVPLGEHSIEYKSEDCCGNVGRSYLKLIVEDKTPPVAISKEFIVVSLTNISNPVNGYQGTAKIFARDLDNGSYDGCSEVTVKVRRDGTCRNADAYWGDFVTFCCEDLQGVSSREIDVELLITDEKGNDNIVWTTVLLEDKSGDYPVVPPHMIVTCDMDLGNLDLTGGLPRSYGACGESVVACDTSEVIENTVPRELRLSDGVVINGVPQEAPAYDPSCGSGALRRNFRDCGGGVQWFIVLPVDPFDNSSLLWPDDVVVDCNDYDNGEPEWLQTTCNLVGVTVERDTFIFEDNSCMKILNHWTVIDWCLYNPGSGSNAGKYFHTQLVKIIDNIDPEIILQDSICLEVYDGCESSDLLLGANGVDDGKCGSNWLSWELSIDLYSNWTEDYFYSSSEPRSTPAGEPNAYYIPKSGNGEDVLIALPDGIPGSKTWHRAIWRVYDGCGNISSRMQYFQVTDKKAPTPYCLNLSTAVMENGQVEIWAVDFDRGSFDNCSADEELLFTFTDIVPPGRDDSQYDSNADLIWYNGTFWYYDSEETDVQTGAGEYADRDDYGGEIHRWEPGIRSAGKVFTIDDADNNGFVEVPVYVWDGCGNRDHCNVMLRLVDNGGGGMAMVSGRVVTEKSEALENVLTHMTGPLNFNVNDITDNDGRYAFANTPFYADYQIRGYKNDDYTNGVSTLDLVMMQRHILGQQSLDSPYKIIAADVNNDRQITAVDLIELRKLILGVYDELPQNDSWKLIDAKNLPTLNSPFNYSTMISLEDLAADQMDEDFMAIKIGDVNNSAAVRSGSSTNSRTDSAPVTWDFEDRQLEEGELFEISLNTDGLEGLQFAFRIHGLELLDVMGMNADMSNVFIEGSSMRVSISNPGKDSGNTSLTLLFQATEAGTLDEKINMGSYLPSEAYLADGKTIGIQLNNSREKAEILHAELAPNPFTEETRLKLVLSKPGPVSLSLVAPDGKMVWNKSYVFDAGNQIVELDANAVNTGGMYLLKIIANNEVKIIPLVSLK